MKHFDFFRLFADNAGVPAKNNPRKRSRTCRIEELESRELLDAGTFAAIKDLHADLNLGEYEDYNYIEIQLTGVQTDDGAAIRKAITDAGNTAGHDIIVVHTTTANNGIVLQQNSLEINTASGDVIIVGYGEANLTLDGNKIRRVFDISAGTTVGLAGIIITNV